MGLRNHLAPPDFYLSFPKIGKVMQFTDVENLNTIYAATPNVQPLLGHTAPYVGEGSGQGLRWIIEAKMNPWNGFLTEPNPGSSARDPAKHPYDELLELDRFIQDFGPTPLAVLHREGHDDDVTVAITEFDSEINLSQSNPDEEERPSVIPVRLALIERREFRVKVF